MKDIIMVTLAEELQPILTRATVMPESQWNNYHLLLQNHYHLYSVDNRGYKNYVLYNTYYTSYCTYK
jgi:hypothetical protein